MRTTHRRLHQVPDSTVRRVLTGDVRLSESGETWVTVTRTGSFTDPRYGRFEITNEMLLSMVRNFDARVVGVDIFIDVDHKPGDGAAARILALKVEGNRLRARVEWTDLGREAIQKRGFRYLSAEYDERWKDNEAGRDHGPTLLGAGLTVRPAIKHLDPVTLAQDPRSNAPVLMHPELLRQLTHDLEQARMTRIEKLRKLLAAAGVGAAHIEAIVASYTNTAKTLSESDDAAHDGVIEQLVSVAKTLAAPTQTFGPDDVKKLLAEHDAARDAQRKTLADTLEARRGVFTKVLADAKGLSDATRTRLAKGLDIVTGEMSEDQVKALAAQFVEMGNQMEASRQLTQMGFAPTGHIQVDESNAPKKLAETIRQHLRGTAAFGNGQIRAVDEEKISPFAKRVLAQYDRDNAMRLHQDSIALSGGVVNIADTALPASYTREVIAETLADLRILEIVDADVDPTTSATHNIPYETRDTAAVYSNGIVYEGQAIHQAGIRQQNFVAYIAPMKIAMEITNEAMFFTRANSNINWDAWGRNVASNAQLARELIARRLMNELQRAADAYGAVARSAEAFDSQLTGSNSVIKTTHFPIVRPFQARDLQGNAIGSAENPITVVLNGTTLSEYNGTGTQAAGTYWRVTNYNLGYIQLVNEAGVAQTPSDSGTNTVSYSSASNIVKVDMDVASGSFYERQMNKILQGVGSRKAALSQQSFVNPDFALVSQTLHNSITDAENFGANSLRNGTALDAMGDLAAIKGLPCWGTNTPGDIGEQRLLLGQRGTVKYRIAKTFAIGAPFEIFNSAGKPVGKKGAYGEEYSSMCVPTPIRQRVTSVIAYSFTNR